MTKRKSLEEELSQKPVVKSNDFLYRAVVENGIFGGFVIDSAGGRTISVDQFGDAVKGGVSCGLSSIYTNAGINPWDVFKKFPKFRPLIPGKNGHDCIIEFSTSVLDNLPDFILLHIADNDDLQSLLAKHKKDKADVWNAGHVSFQKLPKYSMEENDLFELVEELNKIGWSPVSP